MRGSRYNGVPMIKLFPDEANGWELPLNAEFPDRD
jgi:hypothetical protein